jgi:putative ABC transport system substrate-binding protein
MFDELRRAGFIEGQNLVIIGGFGLRANEFSQQAVSIANSGIDAMYAGGDNGIRAAQAATRTIPIVAISEDMVAAGLVHSLARPGGNTTGVSILSSNLNGKRQEILIEAVPTARMVAVLADANVPITPSQLQGLQEAMGRRGVDLVTYTFRTMDEIVPAIDAAKASGAAALNVLGSPLTSALAAGGQQVIERTTALKLPSSINSRSGPTRAVSSHMVHPASRSGGRWRACW